MIPPGCVSLSSLVASAGASASAGGAGSVSAICTSSSCFFRWYPLVVSHPSSPVASADGADGISTIYTSSSCFFRWNPRLRLLRHPLLRLLVPVRLLVLLVVCLLFVRVRVVFLDDTLWWYLLVVHLFV